MDLLAVCTTVYLLPETHQPADVRKDPTVGDSETHVPNRAGLGLRSLTCHMERGSGWDGKRERCRRPTCVPCPPAD